MVTPPTPTARMPKGWAESLAWQLARTSPADRDRYEAAKDRLKARSARARLYVLDVVTAGGEPTEAGLERWLGRKGD